MAEYIVTFNLGSEMSAWEANDINELLTVVYEYCGGRKEVIKRALIGCKTICEKVEMYNTLSLFSDNKIERIREVKERIYG